MTKKILLILILILGFKRSIAQDYMIQSPQQLGLGTSTARVGNWIYANSSLAQAFYSNQSRITLSMYIPYAQLTDGKMNTNSFQYYSPSFGWGGLNFSYSDYSVNNLSKQIMGTSSFQFGYINALFNRLIIATNFKWQKSTWYSDYIKSQNVQGSYLDVSAIYILSGYTSLGVSMTNLVRKDYSSINNDAPAREIRLGYSWLNNEISWSVEGGLIAAEDAFLEANLGGFFNSELKLPFGFRIGSEYKHLFHNEFGTVISFNYLTNIFNAEISYGLRIDDSPMPISTLQHSLGIHMTLNTLKSNRPIINPQIILRDNTAPDIYIKRLCEYNVFMNKDETDNLKLKTSIKDDESGINLVDFSIVSAKDTTNILYTRQYNTAVNIFTDTIQFDGYTLNGEFFENGRYFARISAIDVTGNKNSSDFIPFRVLSKRNDSEGPEISLSFDTTELKLEESEQSILLSSTVSIDDKESDWIQWRVQLFKMRDDSTWSGLQPTKGAIEISEREFNWLLRKTRSRQIKGNYRIKIEAKDELNNSSVIWSDIKTIIQTEQEQKEESDSKSRIKDTVLPEVVYLSEEVDSDMNQKPGNSFIVEASYNYRGKEVKLSDFSFVEGQKFNPYANQLSISVLGVYLQDIPKAKLIIKSPQQLKDIPKFESEMRNFLNEAYDIEINRIQLKYNSEDYALHFYIRE